MKTLKNCVKLNSSVKIYVPSTKNVDEKTDSLPWVDKSLKCLSNWFGGATASPSLGAWVSARGDLVKEDITLVFSYAKQSDLETHIEEIYNLCLEIKSSLTQEAIALEINGELYLI